MARAVFSLWKTNELKLGIRGEANWFKYKTNSIPFLPIVPEVSRTKGIKLEERWLKPTFLYWLVFNASFSSNRTEMSFSWYDLEPLLHMVTSRKNISPFGREILKSAFLSAVFWNRIRNSESTEDWGMYFRIRYWVLYRYCCVFRCEQQLLNHNQNNGNHRLGFQFWYCQNKNN